MRCVRARRVVPCAVCQSFRLVKAILYKYIKKIEQTRTHLARFGEAGSDYEMRLSVPVTVHCSSSVQHKVVAVSSTGAHLQLRPGNESSQVMLTEPPKQNTMVIA